MSHPDHTPDLKRLNRIVGQLEGVGRMINDGRYCPEILGQIRAVHSALKGLEAQLLKRHINHCLRSAIESEDEAIIEGQVEAVVDLFRKQ